MNSSSQALTLPLNLPLTLPLSQADCQWAESQAAALCCLQYDDPSSAHNDGQGDRDRHSSRDRAISAHQIQCTTLASLAARYYLRLLGIRSELTLHASPPPAPSTGHHHPDSPEHLNRPLNENLNGHLNGELTLASNQRLSCLPVVAGRPLTGVVLPSNPDEPPEPDHLGTIAIQLDLPQRQAQVMGFLPNHAAPSGVAQKPLSLQPIAMLINRLSTSPITPLQKWLVGQLVTGWQQLCRPQPAPNFCFRSLPPSGVPQKAALTQSMETALLNTIRYSADDEQRWQAAEQLWSFDPTHPESPILRTKDMGLYLLGHSITLLVGILAKPNQQRLILVRLLPSGEQPYLPHALTLTGQDETGDTVFSIRSRQQDDYIQFKFTAAVGDRFQLQISWHTASVIEQFIV